MGRKKTAQPSKEARQSLRLTKPTGGLPPGASAVPDESVEQGEYREIRPDEIEVPQNWNSRGPRQEKDELSDAELEQSIRQRGLLQPLRVRNLSRGRYSLVFGFRRHRACVKIAPTKPVPCLVMPSTGDEAKDDVRARFENLTENGQRAEVSTVANADAFYELRFIHEVPLEEIAKRTGFSQGWVMKLYYLRKNLCPELLKAWRANPDRFSFRDLDAISSQPKYEQVDAYNALLREKRGGRPKGAKTSKVVRVKDVELWQRELDLAPARGAEQKAFVRGARFALSAVDGDGWDLRGAMKERS